MKEQSRGRSRGKSPKLKNRKSRLISLAAAAAGVLVIISAVAALRGRDTLLIREPVYTSINGIRMDLEEGVKLSHKDDTTTLNISGTKQNMENFPLITADETSIILQKSYSWNRTADEGIYRLDYFTTVSRDGEGILIKRREKESRDISGFLYDNGDTYVFLEPVTLSYNDQTRKLEPMTVVQVSYLGSIQIFGPGTEAVFETVSTEAVTAEFAGGKRVNLATDRYYMINGSWRLLFLPLDVLPEMK